MEFKNLSIWVGEQTADVFLNHMYDISSRCDVVPDYLKYEPARAMYVLICKLKDISTIHGAMHIITRYYDAHNWNLAKEYFNTTDTIGILATRAPFETKYVNLLKSCCKRSSSVKVCQLLLNECPERFTYAQIANLIDLTTLHSGDVSLISDLMNHVAYDVTKTTLLHACQFGHVKVMNEFLRKYENIDYMHDMLKHAVYNDQMHVLNILLSDTRSMPHVLDSILLESASKRGIIRSVKALLDDGRSDPNKGIIPAIVNKHVDIVRLLLEDPRVDPSENDHEPIKIALKHDISEIIIMQLLKHDHVDPSFNHNQVFLHASRRGYINVVEHLLEDDRTKPQVITALDITLQYKHFDIFKIILET